MKKIIALLLAAVMLTLTISLVSCGGTKDPGDQSKYKSSLELFKKIWGSYTDDEKFFCAGGDEEHDSEDAPGIVDIEKYKDYIMSNTHITQDLLGMVTNDAASLAHMNTNTFSSAIFRLKDASTAEKFANDYNAAIQDTHWMCGFPDSVIVVSVGEYIIVALGDEELISTFKTKCLAADTSAKLLIDNAIEA